MVAVLTPRRKVLATVFACLSGLLLSACDVPLPSGPLLGNTRTVKVALLVPQSSANGAPIALSLENAARLAAEDLGEGVQIDLLVYDTGGTPAGAEVAARNALSDGAKVFLGPLFAEAANSAGQVAASRGVNVLTFSNNPSIAGGNVFILGNTFQTSADRLVRYAVGQGKGDVYIVHAQDAAENIGANSIERAIAANGARLAGVTSFPLSQQGVIDAIPDIARNYRESGATSVFATSGTAGALPFLAELLPENGIDRETSQFIGLQRLDVPSSALSLKGLQGAWFATPSPTLQSQFQNRYQAAYGSLPHPIAGLAYDGIAAIGSLVATGEGDALSAASLTQGQGFAGVNGPFRFFLNGTNERGLAVATIENNQVIILDPAPRSFGGVGF